MERNFFDGHRAYKLLELLNFKRETGTDGELEAAKIIFSQLPDYGCKVNKENFNYLNDYVIRAELRVDSADYAAGIQQEYPVRGYIGSKSTDEKGLCGELIYIENADEISLKKIKGRIALVNGYLNGELYQKIQLAGAEAVIAIVGSPLDQNGTGLPCRVVLRNIKEALIPALLIHHKDAVKLIHYGCNKVSIFLQQTAKQVSSQNIVAEIQGTDLKDEILTITAHYDSVPDGPGAYDNLAGAAIVLEVFRYFYKNRPRRTLKFIWFGSEETGLNGSIAYVRQHKSELIKHKFNMNVDLAGQLIGGNVLGITAGEEVLTVIKNLMIAEEIGIDFKRQIWSSDSNTFAAQGIPASTLNRDGVGMHTCFDTIDLVHPKSLVSGCIALGAIAEYLANIDTIPFAIEVPPEMLAKLENLKI